MTICVIPARFNSSRFPGKLLAKAGGKTVLQRTFESAKASKELDALYVATDDEKIADHVREFKGEVIWTSPLCKNGTERVLEAFSSHPVLKNSEIILNLQGDHPLTTPETISQMVQLLKKDEKADVSTAVTKIIKKEEFFSPHVVKCVFDAFSNALYFSRAPIPFSNGEFPFYGYAHIGIYCYRSSFLVKWHSLLQSTLSEREDLEQLRILESGFQIKVAQVNEPILGIDTPSDLARLKETLYQKINAIA